MIRPRWLPRAARLGARSLSSSSSSARDPKDPRWRVPGRKIDKEADDGDKLGIPNKVELDPRDDEFARWRKPVGPQLNPVEETSRLEARNQFRKRNPEAHRMLVLQGLPTSLVSNDFLRLNAKDLASWRNLIKEGASRRVTTTTTTTTCTRKANLEI